MATASVCLQGALLAALATCVAPAFAVEPAGSTTAMEWVDLRAVGRSDVDAYRQLWRDRLEPAQTRWAQTALKGKLLPAYSLGQVFPSGTPVLVSMLFDMFDCELPGNGSGADLYARCPMRVIVGAGGLRRVKTFESVCTLHVPPVARPADGPSAAANYTSVALDAARVLHVRVVQYGRPVRGCDADFPLE